MGCAVGTGRAGTGQNDGEAVVRRLKPSAPSVTGPIIAIIGGSAPTRGEAATAEAVGHALAAEGAILICGGRGGVMKAACRGAKQAGGLTIGILPGTNRRGANPYVDIPIVTGIGEARAGGRAGDVGGEARRTPARAHRLRCHGGGGGRSCAGAGTPEAVVENVPLEETVNDEDIAVEQNHSAPRPA